MLKKIFCYTFLIAATGFGCTKDGPLQGSEKAFASVSLTNVNASGKTVDFIIDGVKKTVNAPVGANATILGTYVGINGEPNHAITVRDATTTTLDYFIGTISGTPENSYAFFAYDTLSSGKIKGVLLTADRNLKPNNTTTSNARFLNFSPKSPALDCWLVRIVGAGAAAVRTDSVKLATSAGYIGNSSPDVAKLSAYTSIRSSQLAGANGTGSLATSYAIKLVMASTNTVVGTQLATSFVPGRNYTLYARGLYPSTATSILADN